MKKGLVSPPSFGTQAGVSLKINGFPIENVGSYIVYAVDEAETFEVSLPLFWTDVPDEASGYQWYYRNDDSTPYAIASATYYATEDLPAYDATLGQSVIVSPAETPQPSGTTTSVPPTLEQGQSLYWYEGAWVASSFNPSLELSQAKNSLIKQVEQDAALAVNAESSQYSEVQKITAPDVSVLETLSYPGTTLGDYQTYVDTIVASSTATITAATSTDDLYVFNPQNLPLRPESSGIIFTGRGAGLGPDDLNVSYYIEWNSTNVLANDTELFIPGTSTVIAYGSGGPGRFDSMGNCFTPGDYRVQIRQTSTGLVLSEFVCPLNPAGENVTF